MAGPGRPAARHRRGPGIDGGGASDEPADPARVHAALTAGLLVARRPAGRASRATTPERATPASCWRPVRCSPGGRRAGSWSPSSSRRAGSTAGSRPGSNPRRSNALAGHLVQRTYSEPHWDAKRGAVMAYERVTLYGLPLVPRRRVGYAQVDPVLARELFIRHALVDGDWQTRHHFFRDNALLRAELAELEERARRRDLLVGDEEIFAFYDARIPEQVVSARHFDGWWKKQRHRTPDLLTLTRDDLLRVDDAAAERPDAWKAGDLSLPLTLPLRAGRRRRRCDRARSGRGAGPAGRRRVRLAGAGAARGAGHRADPVAAERPASQLRSRTRHRAGGAGRDPAGFRAAAGIAAARIAPAHRHSGALRPRSTWTSCPCICG